MNSLQVMWAISLHPMGKCGSVVLESGKALVMSMMFKLRLCYGNQLIFLKIVLPPKKTGFLEGKNMYPRDKT